MKYLILISLTLMFSVSYAEGHFGSFLERRDEVISKIWSIHRLLKQNIQSLEAEAQRKGPYGKLSLQKRRDVRRAFLDIDQIAASIPDAVAQIFKDLHRTGYPHSVGDRADTVRVLILHFSGFSHAQGIDRLDVDEILGELKEGFFVLNNAVGHLIFVLRDATILADDLSYQKAKIIQETYKELAAIFDEGKAFILREQQNRFGDRAMKYLRDDTLAFSPVEPGDKFNARDALRRERKIVRELASKLKDLERTPIRVGHSNRLLFARSNGMRGSRKMQEYVEKLQSACRMKGPVRPMPLEPTW